MLIYLDQATWQDSLWASFVKAFTKSKYIWINTFHNYAYPIREVERRTEKWTVAYRKYRNYYSYFFEHLISSQTLGKALYFYFLFSNFILFIFIYNRCLLVINFIHISVYMSIPISQFISPPPLPLHHFTPLVSIRLFSTSVSPILPGKPVHLFHFSRFHIHALIYKYRMLTHIYGI